MAKLSNAQLELLRILRDEDTAVYTHGILNKYAFISGDHKAGRRSPNIRTVYILAGKEMIKNITDGEYSKYRISQAGLGALKEAGI